MGIKEAPGPTIMGIIPVVVTILAHLYLKRNILAPLKNLSLEVAAHVDIDEGELSGGDEQIYGQPALKDNEEDRAPLPYRREEVAEQTRGKEVAEQTSNNEVSEEVAEQTSNNEVEIDQVV